MKNFYALVLMLVLYGFIKCTTEVINSQVQYEEGSNKVTVKVTRGSTIILKSTILNTDENNNDLEVTDDNFNPHSLLLALGSPRGIVTLWQIHEDTKTISKIGCVKGYFNTDKGSSAFAFTDKNKLKLWQNSCTPNGKCITYEVNGSDIKIINC